MTPSDLVCKIDYEGGIYEAVCGYGLGVGHLTAKSATKEQLEAWTAVVDAGRVLRKAAERFNQVFPDCDESDD